MDLHLDPIMPMLAGATLVILLIGLVLRRLHQPHVVAYLVAGVILGPHVLDLFSDDASLQRMGAIGVDLLLFFVGMEVSPKKLLANWKLMLIGTLLQVVSSVGCILLLGWAVGWPWPRSVLLGFVISLSSTAVVIKMLQEWKELESRVGQAVLGILLAQDIALVPMLVFVGLMQGGRPDPRAIAVQIVGGAGILLLMGWLMSRKEVRLPFGKNLRKDHELQVFGAAVVCLGMTFLTGLLGLSTALGAFVGGMIVGMARETEWVSRSLEPFRVVFVALFFVSIGMLVDVEFLLQNWKQVAALVAVVMATNTLINAGILRLFGFVWRDGIYGGALLSQIGEFSFVLAAVGFQSAMVSDFAYKATILVISLTLFLSPAWISLVRSLRVAGRASEA